jgi:hypothetical protein
MQPVLDDSLLVSAISRDFGLQLDIHHVVARALPTSHTTTATVFVTAKGQLYAYISGHAPTTLGDIAKQIKHMGLVADSYLPPHHDGSYFERVARAKFESVFPGRNTVSADDLRYYRQTVPYQPALVRIADIPTGVIRQFDSHDSSQWRIAARFSYKKISTVS